MDDQMAMPMNTASTGFKIGDSEDCTSSKSCGSATTSEDTSCRTSSTHGSNSKLWTLPMAMSVIGLSVLLCVVPTVFLMIDKLTRQLQDFRTHTSSLHASRSMADLTGRVESNNRFSAVQDLRDSMQKLQSELLELSTALALARNLTMNGGDELPRGGSTYIRWGKNSCPDNTSLVYTGHAAGTQTNRPFSVGDQLYYQSEDSLYGGGGVQYLCMPPNMQWNKYDTTPGDYAAFAWLWTVLFRTYEKGIFPDGADSTPVACSVCYTPRPAQVMIPAKRECPDSWTLEYEGYLMSGYSEAMSRHTFECVDQNPDINGPALKADKYDSGSAIMVFVSIMCEDSEGNRPRDLDFCQGYLNAREITCVVCSK